MHAAVDKGAEEGKAFAYYVGFLEDNGVVPTDARDWIDEIREHSNQQNHEIVLASVSDAQSVLDFTAMMLRIVYDYPARGKRSKADREARGGA